MQEAGLATYLVAWRGGEPVGRCTVLAASKYDKVRQLFGEFPEMNALEARPQGQGTGTKMIACTERTAREHGAAKVGLAVAVSNDGANRLYQRLGYRDWGHGSVLDHWDEIDSAGRVVKTNADPCRYLTKPIR